MALLLGDAVLAPMLPTIAMLVAGLLTDVVIAGPVLTVRRPPGGSACWRSPFSGP